MWRQVPDGIENEANKPRLLCDIARRHADSMLYRYSRGMPCIPSPVSAAVRKPVPGRGRGVLETTYGSACSRLQRRSA